MNNDRDSIRESCGRDGVAALNELRVFVPVQNERFFIFRTFEHE